MKTMLRTIATLATALGLASSATAASDLPATLKGVVEDNIRGYNAENADAAMSSIHKSSPDYDATKAALPEQFKDFDVRATLVSFEYIGHGDEFVVARVKTKFEAPAGSGFANNVVDSIVLFHQDGAVWKMWSEDVLGVDVAAK